ncbi:hypothetical protein PACTADRAFT_49781 [Pachysolen tannophilus NRRL Y-2460]|uniref:Uncharacterized protein n=1 Tax=Pachysolen tannophilus NRRL Y-2460 TaxID=669874 RepID=A0A1E4TXJ0_PACTA|nr:hypothetical protein PACTADRAFT_49781 [Pachysolen tannophilus NRRL Y-2460]
MKSVFKKLSSPSSGTFKFNRSKDNNDREHRKSNSGSSSVSFGFKDAFGGSTTLAPPNNNGQCGGGGILSRARALSNELLRRSNSDDSEINPNNNNNDIQGNGNGNNNSNSNTNVRVPYSLDTNLVRSSSDSLTSTESNEIYDGEEHREEAKDKLKTARPRISRNDASSIIGGSPVVHTTRSRQNLQFPLDKSNVTGKVDNNVTRNEDEKIVNKNDEHKIFSLQLPFGNSISTKSLPSIKIPFLEKNYDSDEEDEDLEEAFKNISKEELNLKLARQESISTIEEQYLFKNYKGVDNSRFRAIRKALTPSIDLLNKIKDEEKPDYESIYDELEGDIVILGGYRGSILRDAKTHRRLWIPIKAGFNLRKIDLYIGPKIEDELNVEKTIYPDGMLTHIGPIDISKKLIKRLEANPKTTVHDFGYDWRLSSHINAAKLGKLLKEIYDKNGKRGSIVISHSMGGLISHYVLNENPELFRSLIYVGVPSECPNVLGPIRFGDDVLLSDKILTAEVNFMMRSSFVFLPLHGELFVKKYSNEKFILDFFDVNNWINYNLSPLVSKRRKALEDDLKNGKISPSELESLRRHGGTVNTYNNDHSAHPTIVEKLTDFRTSYEDAVEYLTRTLGETKDFLEKLEYREDINYPPLAVVFGNKVPSLRGSRIKTEKDIEDGNWFDFYYGPGDGVVHQKWLMPMKRGFKVDGKFVSDCGHVSLMTDFDAMGRSLRCVFDEEKRRVAASV